jgi:DNA-binding SARP family transcriptional activator
VANRQVGSGLTARDRELSHLAGAIARARENQAAVVVVRGEPGVGKSALLEAAIAMAPDFQLVQLRGVAESSGSPVGRWPEPFDKLLERNPDPSGSAVPLRELPKVPKDECTDALRQFAAGSIKPILIVVDDSQLFPTWFPMALVDAFTKELSDTSVFLLLARTELPHVPSTLPDSPGALELELTGFPTIALSARFLEHRGYGDVSPALLKWLHSQTQGNPNSLIDGYRRLTEKQRTGWDALPPVIPMGLDQVKLFATPLNEMPSSTINALGVVASGHVSEHVRSQVFSELHLDVDVLQEALSAGVLTKHGDRLEFPSSLVRAAAYHQMPQDLRLVAHAVLARSLGYEGEIEQSAYHATQLSYELNDRITGHLEHAARVALSRGDPSNAARFEESAAAFAESSDGRVRHLISASKMWLMVDEHFRASDCANRAVDSAGTSPMLGEALYQVARTKLHISLGDEVIDLMNATVQSYKGEVIPWAALAHLDSAACSALVGRHEEAEEQASRALAIAGLLSSQLEALTRATVGVVRFLGGRQVDGPADIEIPVSLLIHQTQTFAASPHLAYLIGNGTALAGYPNLAIQWAEWTRQCADQIGDMPLRTASVLIETVAHMVMCHFAEADELAHHSVSLAMQSGLVALAPRAMSYSGYLKAIRLETPGAVERSAQIVGSEQDENSFPAVQARMTMALGDLQRGRRVTALVWLHSVVEDFLSDSKNVEFWLTMAPVMGSMLLLTRSESNLSRLHEVSNGSLAPRTDIATVLSLFEGVVATDLESAIDRLRKISSGPATSPIMKACAELCLGVRLVDGGHTTEGLSHLGIATGRFQHMGAPGLATLAEQEMASVTARIGTEVESPSPSRPLPVGTVTDQAPEPKAGKKSNWEIVLLGGFSVRRDGLDVPFPQSLAAQALKIVAIHQKVSVDELVEMLWPDAEPGLGSRRLRNILWRVRGTCGNLLQRNGNFIRLSMDATTDSSRFVALATSSLSGNGSPDEIIRLAEEAIAIYKGELLPGDRYADWAAVEREALSRLRARVLDLLLARALEEQRLDHALHLLELLIDAEPFEESYYLQAAQIHAQAGHPRRAHSTLLRAGKMLDELGVARSTEFLRIEKSLSLG